MDEVLELEDMEELSGSEDVEGDAVIPEIVLSIVSECSELREAWEYSVSIPELVDPEDVVLP